MDSVAAGVGAADHRIPQPIRRVSGVLDRRIAVVADDELEVAVAPALAGSAGPRLALVRVRSSRGVVRLWGNVPEALAEITRSVPGVGNLVFGPPPYAA